MTAATANIAEAIETGEVVDTVRRLAKERPDHVDPRGAVGSMCAYYARDTGQRCIVGQALHEHGVDDDTLAHLDGGAALALSALMGEPAEGYVVAYLSAAQSAQDRGLPWREAVRYADAAVAPSGTLLLDLVTWVSEQGDDFGWLPANENATHYVPLVEAELPE